MRYFWGAFGGSVLHYLVFLVLEKYAFSRAFAFDYSVGAFSSLRNNVAFDFADCFFRNFCAVSYFDKREELRITATFSVRVRFWF